jgi:serine/threonine protein kinase
MNPSPASPEEGAPRALVAEHELVRLIGSGSGGEVWLAKNSLGTYRAVKIIYRKWFPWQKPFEDEFQGLLKFEPLSREHDGLVDVLQVGGNAASDYFYYVMELADDVHASRVIDPDIYVPRTLAFDLANRRRLPIGECIRLGAPIASALGFLHRHELIHRDIKPANIIFVNGFPKLADPGLVTEMFQARSNVGTEGYIPPEGPGTARADIYGLGKVLYEISTGKDRNDYPELPRELGSPADAQDLIRFNKIVLKACRANPRLRYREAQEMLGDLLAFQFGQRGLFEEKVQRNISKLLVNVGLLAAVGIVCLLIFHLASLLLHSK